MRRSHTFVLVLVTVVLGGAISTASALAEPEFLTKAVVGETAPIVEVEGSNAGKAPLRAISLERGSLKA